ncbi:hypothetical protein [Deinococcus roseus]|uniref:MarR family transcriptional regulator n=1 Tax=Deinococcus roseus TaxID=392414 RepID=A0ABQ2DJN2_9DEIO|nr:hypothetical protein [Deinococcus roseus]GGJ55923.1 hypothetical protein GCM10008938_47610 [Deinococcus roseus]
MSMLLLKEAREVEQSQELHMARLLVLINARKGKKHIDGIMKLAKLDFLLRYPTCLEQALEHSGLSPSLVQLEEHEKTSIESKMVRFKYGPWDARYRQWIGLLVARGLVQTELKGRSVQVTLTEQGQRIAQQLESLPDFQDTLLRSKVIQDHFGHLGSTRIKEFVYQVFPDLKNMRWGEEITP